MQWGSARRSDTKPTSHRARLTTLASLLLCPRDTLIDYLINVSIVILFNCESIGICNWLVFASLSHLLWCVNF